VPAMQAVIGMLTLPPQNVSLSELL
jgi:hypothetical protein